MAIHNRSVPSYVSIYGLAWRNPSVAVPLVRGCETKRPWIAVFALRLGKCNTIPAHVYVCCSCSVPNSGLRFPSVATKRDAQTRSPRHRPTQPLSSYDNNSSILPRSSPCCSSLAATLYKKPARSSRPAKKASLSHPSHSASLEELFVVPASSIRGSRCTNVLPKLVNSADYMLWNCLGVVDGLATAMEA